MSEDLTKCPQCGGEADNGIDRCIPPSAYMCSKCCAQEEAERQAALQESEAGAVAWMYRDYLPPDYEWESGAYSKNFTVSVHKPSKCRDLTPLYLSHQSAQAIETAAIMKCVEVCSAKQRKLAALVDTAIEYGDEKYITVYEQQAATAMQLWEALRALIHQDGRTQLEEFGMRVASKAAGYGWSMGMEGADTMGTDLRAIVTNLIGVPPLSSETVRGKGNR